MHQIQWGPERPLPPPVSLASQSHHEKPPEVTCTSRGNPGFPASTRERPRETFFNTSRGHIPLPWLGSNDALPLATRMDTRLPWRPTRGSLTSPSYLVRNRTLGPPLENNPEIPPSSRDEGLRLLHGLATNLVGAPHQPGLAAAPGGTGVGQLGAAGRRQRGGRPGGGLRRLPRPSLADAADRLARLLATGGLAHPTPQPVGWADEGSPTSAADTSSTDDYWASLRSAQPTRLNPLPRTNHEHRHPGPSERERQPPPRPPGRVHAPPPRPHHGRPVGGAGLLPLPGDRAGLPAPAGLRRPPVDQPDPLRPVRLLGHLVALRAGLHDAHGTGVVRRAVPGRFPLRTGEPHRPGPPGAPLAQVGRLALRGLPGHHGLWPVSQRL